MNDTRLSTYRAQLVKITERLLELSHEEIDVRPIQEQLLTKKRTALILDISEKTVSRMIADGQIDALRIRGVWRIEASSLERYLEKSRLLGSEAVLQ